MHLESLSLTDFRSYASAEFAPAISGITAVTGANGAGKTNLLEAVGYLATLRSMRGSPAEAMVRSGSPAGYAVVRSVIGHAETGRRVTIDAELHAAGRDRVQVNGQPLRRSRDLLGALQVTVFSPDDLELVKGGPAGRRSYLDDLLVAVSPRRDATLSELERILKQRNALLKSAFTGSGWRPGRDLPEDVRFTLEVWDTKLSEVGEDLAQARARLVAALGPLVDQAYAVLSEGSAYLESRRRANLSYRPGWTGTLAEALAQARTDDLRRGVSTVGPHRDELDLAIGELPARTHASQGEQRTLALALRLAGHRLLAGEIGTSPVLLLDDVFSELDRARSDALFHNLPGGQALLTTAGDLPEAAAGAIAVRYRVQDGKLMS